MTSDNSTSIVSKVWNYAHVLKNAGIGYGDYIEQITYLLFFKFVKSLQAALAELRVVEEALVATDEL